MSLLRNSMPLAVSRHGAPAGGVLCGSARHNQGLRLEVLQEQPRGQDGAIQGAFVILDVGDNVHSQALEPLLHHPTDAGELLGMIRRQRPGCVSVVNAKSLVREQPRSGAARAPGEGGSR